MKNKILILVGVLVILVAVVIAPSLMDKFGQSNKKTELTLFEPGTNLTDYAEITVKEEKNSVVLSRNNDIWHVDQVYPADVDHINAFLAEVPKIVPTEIAATSSSSHSRLGLDDENATIVTFDKSVSGNKPLTIYIGNFVRTQDNFFVRRGDQDIAYLATNHLMKELASFRRTEWQSKEVMNVGEKEVTKLSWSGDKKSGSLTKLDDENWQATINGKTFKVKSDRVQPILVAMNPLRGTGFLVDTEVPDLMKGKSGDLTVLGDKNKVLASLNLYLHAAEWWTKISSNPAIYSRMNKADLDKIMVDEAALK